MKANLRKVEWKDSGNIFTKMEISMKDNIKMTFSMDSESFIILMEANKKVNSDIMDEKDLQKITLQMDSYYMLANISEIGSMDLG